MRSETCLEILEQRGWEQMEPGCKGGRCGTSETVHKG